MADEFDLLRAAWVAEPLAEAEMATNRRLWKRAVWRNRLWNGVESVTLLVLSVYLTTWILGGASWQSGLLSAVVLAFLWWSQRKRYVLRGQEIGAPDAERVTLLRRELGRIRARLIRNGLAIGLILPLFALGFVLGRMQRSPELSPPAVESGPMAWADLPVVKWLALALLLLVIAQLARALLRDRHAAARLHSRVEEYRAEYRRDEPGDD